MTMQDPLSDMLTRIRNAHLREKQSVSMPSSKLRESVSSVLIGEGYITNHGALFGTRNLDYFGFLQRHGQINSLINLLMTSKLIKIEKIKK